MEKFQKNAKNVIKNKQEQEDLIERIITAIQNGWYKWIIIFCGNFLLWVNKKRECIACIPELFEDTNKTILNEENIELCKKLDNEKFDTRFSYFSLKIGLEVYKRLSIEKQLLLSVDDKYIEQKPREEYLKEWFNSVPNIYREEMRKYFQSENEIKDHLKFVVSKICDSPTWKINDFLLSEKYLVRRYKARQQASSNFLNYNEYYQNLWTEFTSCSLEIFHLLTIIQEKKYDIFMRCEETNKICILMFVPDACTSSAMQWGIVVSKTNENFEIINITQTTTIQEWVMMITKISKWGVERL